MPIRKNKNKKRRKKQQRQQKEKKGVNKELMRIVEWAVTLTRKESEEEKPKR